MHSNESNNKDFECNYEINDKNSSSESHHKKHKHKKDKEHNKSKHKGKRFFQPKMEFTKEEAAIVTKKLGIFFENEKFTLDDFTKGMNVELEHGKKSPKTDVSNDDPIITGKIALAHLREIPDYYDILKKLEQEAIAYWASRYHYTE